MNPQKLVQGSPEWMQFRVGKCTGSRMKDVQSFLRDEITPSQKQKGYAVELIAERLTGSCAEHYVSPEMRFGSENERNARAAYMVREGMDVEAVGIYQNPRVELFCASPDGLVGTDGLVEFKVPKSATHIAWMMDDVIPEEHLPQLWAELACSGKAFVDFVSFDPRMPVRHQLFIKRLYSDPFMVAASERHAVRFLKAIDLTIERLNEINPEIELPAPAQDEMEGLGLTEDDLRYLDTAPQHLEDDNA